MIPVVTVYLFIFIAGVSVGWIVTHCILGYRYEKLIRDEYRRKTKTQGW